MVQINEDDIITPKMAYELKKVKKEEGTL